MDLPKNKIIEMVVFFMKKSRLNHILLSLLTAAVLMVIGIVIGLLIEKLSNTPLTDVMFYEGIAVVIIGSLSMMRGNPSGIDLSGLGQTNAQYSANENLEAIRMQRESTDYYKNFKEHSIVKLTFSGTTLLLGGIFIVLYSAFLTYF